MKRSLLFSAMGAFGLVASAQMANNSICPDFTGTDLDGVQHHLYDYLDQGKTVVVDVSATWCGPCWNYHNGGALETLWAQHGPDGTDDVMVLFVEGDGATTNADLHGTGSNTQGDWVTGTPYPIIDNASIANLLEISYYPTLYKICPNRVITEVGQVSATAWWTSIQTCPIADTPHDATVLPNLENPFGCAGSAVDLKVRLQNVGTSSLTGATIQAKEGNTVLGSTDWSGSLNMYDLQEVNVTSIVPTNNMNITYLITTTDDDAGNNSVNGTVAASSAVLGLNVHLELKTDQYGTETTWKLFDGNGTVVHQSPVGSYGANTVYNYDWTLQDNDCYRFEIYDAYGDGICCAYGNGYYKLSVNGNVIIQGAEFTTVDVRPFKTDVDAGVEVINHGNALNIYPNPTTGLVNLDFGTQTAATVEVFNVLGERVMTSTFNSITPTMDLSTMPNGVYYMNVKANGQSTTRKVTVNK